MECSGDNCVANCDKNNSCQYLSLRCYRGNCTLRCRDYLSCQYSTVVCPSVENGQCYVHCDDGYGACQYSDFTCPSGGNCVFQFGGRYSRQAWIGAGIDITCQENSICTIICAGNDSNSNGYQCVNSRITCPRENGKCTLECSGYRACQTSGLTVAATNCTGRHSCRYATITCPANNNCTINCDGQSSCGNTRVICPTGDYSCNILCTDPLSCSNLSITNTHNVYLQCCGGLSCAGTSVTPALTECPY